MFLRNIVNYVIMIAIVLLIGKGAIRIKQKAGILACILILYIVVDSVLLNSAVTDYKEIVLLIIRILGILIILGNISKDDFKNYYLKIIPFLCVLSLVCYSLTLIGVTLPGTMLINGSYGSFYHVVGFNASGIRLRNSGIFTEPGIYQLFINIALLILWTKRDITINKTRKLLVLFSITMVSTFSSMGYLIYSAILMLFIFYRPEVLGLVRIKKRNIGIFITLALVIVGVIEINTHIITSFVVNTNSWASRHDDTILSFKIAFDYPLFGIGLATDPLPIWKEYYERYAYLRLYFGYQEAMSCGLGNYACMGGLPFALWYLIKMIQHYFNLLEVKGIIQKLVIAGIVLLIVLEEPLMPTPFFLVTIFTSYYWNTGNKLKRR